MRKYNSKTKRTIIIIFIIFIVFIIIFSLFIKKYSDVKKAVYTIDPGSILFDVEQNKITTKEESTVKIKWQGDYYLQYTEKNYNLGKHSVVYNTNNGDISLYGKFYDVQKNGKVKVIKNENKIKSSINSKFYKLEDRKYLIIDRTIEAVNSSLVTSNYLIVNLDKSGNATLQNDKVSQKTITPTKLRTSSYIFDIANETINFGEEEIDLKKIIGTTNKYDEDTYDLNAEPQNEEDKQNGEANNNGTNGTGQDGQDTQNQTAMNQNGTTAENSTDYNNNYDSGISDNTVEEVIKATKNTSVIRIVSNINSMTIDYVVYDPDNEYKSVFVEIENTTTGKTNTVYLSKNDTKITINELSPDVYYNLKFKYSYLDNGQMKETTFDTFGTYTEVPKISLTVPKVIDGKVYFKISLDDKYNILGGAINLLVNGQVVKSTSISPQGNRNEISGDAYYFDISDLNLNHNNNTTITLKLVSLSFNTYTINPNVSYKFKY